MSVQWEAPPSFNLFVQERHQALLRFAYVLNCPGRTIGPHQKIKFEIHLWVPAGAPPVPNS